MEGVRIMRNKKGMTQRELANRLCVAQSTVAMWETGENTPRGSTLPAIANELGCTIDELFNEDQAS